MKIMDFYFIDILHLIKFPFSNKTLFCECTIFIALKKVPIGGALVRQPASIGGSGSTYLYGFLDAHYKEGMEKEKVIELAKQAVTLAITRDGASGGCVR